MRTEGVFGSSGMSRLTPLNLNWEELTYKKIDVKVYENSGATPTPHSTFKLRYDVIQEENNLITLCMSVKSKSSFLLKLTA